MDKGWSEANNVVNPQDFAGSEETFAVRNTNGTGPFKLVSRAPDELTVMEKNMLTGGAMVNFPATSIASNIAQSAMQLHA